MADHKAQIPVGSCKVAVHGFYGPTSWVNVYYVVVDAGSHTPGDVIAAVASWFHTLYHDSLAGGAVTGQWRLSSITVTYRDATDSLVRVRVADATVASGSPNGQDGQVCYLINWSTGDPRRGGKPRTYVTGVIDENMADSAFVTSAHIAAINPLLLTWLESGPGLSIPMQLVEMSFRDANTWRDTPHTYPIIGVSMNPVVATQRRRVDRLRPS